MKIKWSNIPFSPAQCPFFYGWVLLGATTIGIVASIPGQTMGVGIFTDFLIENLGLTRSQLSLAYALGTVSSGLLLPWAGRGVDRFGIRPSGVFAAIGLALSLVFLANLTAISQAIPLAGAVAPMLAVYLCFLLLRFFGQGSLTMVSRVAIGKWFNHYRGRAVAIMGIFAAFSFNASPQFLNFLLNEYSGSGSALVLAAIVGFGMTAIALVFYRDTPEESGLVMDGVSEAELAKNGNGGPRPEVRQFTRAEARRTLAFWAYTCAPATQGLIMTAITFHMASLGEEAGLSREAAYSVFFPMAFFSVASNTIGGWLSEPHPPQVDPGLHDGDADGGYCRPHGLRHTRGTLGADCRPRPVRRPLRHHVHRAVSPVLRARAPGRHQWYEPLRHGVRQRRRTLPFQYGTGSLRLLPCRDPGLPCPACRHLRPRRPRAGSAGDFAEVDRAAIVRARCGRISGNGSVSAPASTRSPWSTTPATIATQRAGAVRA